MKLSIDDILSFSPDETNLKTLLSYLQKNSLSENNIKMVHLVDALGLDVSSQILSMADARASRLFDILCAQQVEELITDQRSKDAMRIASLYANNNATEAELMLAYKKSLDAYNEKPTAINAVAVLTSRLDNNSDAYRTYKSVSSAAKIAVWNNVCQQQEVFLLKVATTEYALAELIKLSVPNSTKILSDNRAKGRLVLLKENDIIRKYWFFKNPAWFKEHVSLLNKVVPGYVAGYGKDDLGNWIEFYHLPGTPVSEYHHTDKFIKDLYTMCIDYNTQLFPYSHGDWSLGNMFIHDKKLYMCDWDDLGQYPEDTVSNSIKTGLRSAFGEKFDKLIQHD